MTISMIALLSLLQKVRESGVHLFFAWMCAILAWGQTAPKAKPSDYPAQARSANLTIAAEFLGHSFAGENGMYVAEDFLVVDVALYPDRGAEVPVVQSHFTLQLNKDKIALVPVTPQFVGASLRHEDWRQRPALVAGAGVGDGAIVIGRPRSSERFPGDPTAGQAPPRAPEPVDRSGVERAPAAQPADVAVSEALVEGLVTGPVRGYLYFAYRGKLKNVKKAALLYRGASIALR